MIRFEALAEHHMTEVKAIYDWYVANSTATFHTGAITREELREFIYINHALYKSFLIKDDDGTAGYCVLTNHKKRQAYNRTAEVTLYLAPQYCGRGIGVLALQHLEQVAKTAGLKNLIGTISGDNTGSIALFEKAGYTKCAHYRNIGEKFDKVIDVVAYQKEI